MAVRRKRVFKTVAIISGVMTILSVLYPAGLKLILKFMLSQDAGNLNTASSIGIIGGADGPTAVFIASNSGIPHLISWFGFTAICAMISIVSFLLMRKRK